MKDVNARLLTLAIYQQPGNSIKYAKARQFQNAMRPTRFLGIAFPQTRFMASLMGQWGPRYHPAGAIERQVSYNKDGAANRAFPNAQVCYIRIPKDAL